MRHKLDTIQLRYSISRLPLTTLQTNRRRDQLEVAPNDYIDPLVVASQPDYAYVITHRSTHLFAH